jgi:hypothetical protein
MDGVKAAGFFFGEAHGFDSDNFETGFMNPCKDFTLQMTANGIGFNNCECPFDCH